jgi:diguanylate cyclase (GGDEF)-like protein
MARKRTERSSGYTILVVDDNEEYLEVTRRLLEREGHEVLAVTNGPDALAQLRQSQIDLLLLDYFMPGMTGEDVVVQLRQFNPYVQVILQTGYASEQPPRELLRRLEIQGYYDKSEGPDKLLLWTDVGLRVAYTIQLLNKSRQGLRYILDVTPDLHKIQPLEDLLQGILWQVTGLLGAVNSFLAVLPEGGILRVSPPAGSADGFVAMVEEDTELTIRAGTGRFVGQNSVTTCVEKEKLGLIRRALQQGEIQIVETLTVVPLRVGDVTLGVVYLDRPTVLERDLEILYVFANQAAVAIQNSQLYEMATLDPMTGVYVRRFFDKWLLRELRTAFRSQQPLSLLMIDLDGLKRINDTAGHLVGDQALTALGKVLKQATRESDIVGRYGGDEFAIVLPQAPMSGAEMVGRRIIEFLQEKTVPGPDSDLLVGGSIGLCVLEPHTFASADLPRPISQNYFQAAAQALIQGADEGLYDIKKAGGHKLAEGKVVQWPAFDAVPNPVSEFPAEVEQPAERK